MIFCSFTVLGDVLLVWMYYISKTLIASVVSTTILALEKTGEVAIENLFDTAT